MVDTPGAYYPLVERSGGGDDDDDDEVVIQEDEAANLDGSKDVGWVLGSDRLSSRGSARGSIRGSQGSGAGFSGGGRPQFNRHSPGNGTRLDALVRTEVEKEAKKGEFAQKRSRSRSRFSIYRDNEVATWWETIEDNLVIVPDPGDQKFPWLRAWNDLIVISLALAAYVVPFHVAFPQESDRLGYHYFIRTIDTCFILDIIVNFFIAFKDPEEASDVWVLDLPSIAKRYCGLPCTHRGEGGMLWVDLLSVLPGFYEIFVGKPPATSVWGRLSHALRLSRLFRLLQSSKIEHFEQTIEGTRVVLGLRYYLTEALKFIYITTLTCHIAACVWIGVEGQVTYPLLPWTKNYEASWLSNLIAAKGDACYPEAKEDPMCVYTISLYWAMMTLTTVGYGDITPQNRLEYTVCTIFMLISGFVWAYIVAQVVNLLYSIDPQGAQFKQDTDAVNALMANRSLPQTLRVELRRYMVEGKHVNYLRNQQELLSSQISISLQGKVAQHSPVTQVLRQKVFWCSDLDNDAMLEVVRILDPYFFGPREVIPINQNMIIMQRGVAAVNGRMLFKNDVYGEELILLESASVDSAVPRTLSYVDILSLTKERLQDVCRIFPQADARMRKAQIKTAVFRAFIRAARDKVRFEYSRTANLGARQRSPMRRGLTGAMETVSARRSFANFQDEFGLRTYLPMSLAQQNCRIEESLELMESRLMNRMEEMLAGRHRNSIPKGGHHSPSLEEQEQLRQNQSSRSVFRRRR